MGYYANFTPEERDAAIWRKIPRTQRHDQALVVIEQSDFALPGYTREQLVELHDFVVALKVRLAEIKAEQQKAARIRQLERLAAMGIRRRRNNRPVYPSIDPDLEITNESLNLTDEEIEYLFGT